jgi:tRNA (guanine37-N1)-methyltransferase
MDMQPIPIPSKRPRTSSENSNSNPRRKRTSSKGKVNLCPPSNSGMTKLDKSAFDKNMAIPAIVVYEDQMQPDILRHVKPFLLKIQGIKPIQEHSSSDQGGGDENNDKGRKTKKIFLDPELFNGKNLIDVVKEELKLESKVICSIRYDTIKFTYENWTWSQIFESVLPDNQDKLSSYSQIGHIIHVNLREHLWPYKTLIGEVFLDKIVNAKTVVNKLTNIDNTYRNFQMEILAGDTNTVVQLKENRCDYEFDFKDVYWNPRLSAEHERIVTVLKAGDIMYDVFAGVGPFAVPAGKKKCFVFANDLNPASFQWLQRNVTKNKVHGFVKCFNQDGKDFIKTTISTDIMDRMKTWIENKDSVDAFDFINKKFHIVMNLPAIAVEFLDSLWGILKEESQLIPPELHVMVHVYCFIKDIEEFKEKALQLVEAQLKYKLPKENIFQIIMVRNVAPNKEMLRVSFTLPHCILAQTLPSSS